MNKAIFYIQKMEYYSTLKKKEVLPYETTQVNLEDIMPSDQLVTGGYILHAFTYMRHIKQSNSQEKGVEW